MSLAVSADLLANAQEGKVDDTAFLDCGAASLPYARDLISGLVGDLDLGRRRSSPATRCQRRTRRPGPAPAGDGH